MGRESTATALAAIAFTTVATNAVAQTPIQERPGQTATTGNDATGGDFSLLGTGATSIAPVLMQELNCIGGFNQLGRRDGTLVTIAEPTALPTPAGPVNCATDELQPKFRAKYVATGSGFGRQAWRTYTDQFAPTPSGTAPFAGDVFNPYVGTGNAWPHVQFAFAASMPLISDVRLHAAGRAQANAGPAVIFPL